MDNVIRLATEGDAEQVLSIYGPFCRTPVSFEEEPPSLATMRQRIVMTLPRFPWLICERAGHSVGYAYAQPHRQRAAYRWSVEVSAYVREQQRRRGVGRSLYTSLLRLLRLQGLYSAYAGITLPNPASVGLHEAMGFRPVGVYLGVGYNCGAWRDVGWWQRALREHEADPAPPLEMSRLRETPAWKEALQSGAPSMA
jgi:phosphinothricin acetyltransferase